jgi:hypothetical protein
VNTSTTNGLVSWKCVTSSRIGYESSRLASRQTSTRAVPRQAGGLARGRDRIRSLASYEAALIGWASAQELPAI